MPNSPSQFTEADIAALYPRLRSVARRLVSDAADVDDIVQTALERAWRSRDRFASDASVGPWLTTITRRAAIDLLRSRRADFAPLDESFPASDVTETSVLRRETAESLGTAIASLPPTYRDAILLHDVQGLSSREIASRGALPYHTVRTHLFRARKALRSAVASGVAA